MKTDNIALVITVQKLNKTFICTDQFGVNHKIDTPEDKTGIPDWRYRKAQKGNFKLIKKYDKNGIVHWKKYNSEKDGEIIMSEPIPDIATDVKIDIN